MSVHAPETVFRDQASQHLLDGLPAAVLVAGSSGDVLYANPEASRLLGPGVTMLEARGGGPTPWLRAATGDAVEREFVQFPLPAGLLTGNVSARPVEFGGRFAALVVITPVSDRELDRDRSEGLLSRVFMSNPHAMVLFRLKSGLILNVNDRWLEFFGRTRSEAVGALSQDLDLWACPKQREQVSALLDSRRSVRDVEAALKRKDGKVREALLSIEILEAGPDPVGLTIITDISERKAMRRDLNGTLDRFRLFVESVRDYAIFLLDAQGKIISWNPGAERLYGYKEEEMLGRDTSVLTPADERAGRKYKRLLETAAKTGRASVEGRRERKDGSSFWCETAVTALRDEAGVLTGFAKITRDLTERRKAEEAEHHKRREEIQREIVANVSHELRTPIAAIRGFVETLLKGGLEDKRHRKGFVGIIDKHAAHLSRMVEDILNLSALDAGGAGTAEDLDLSKFVAQAVDGLRPLIARRGLKTTVSVEPELIVRADPHRLSQVLGNLMGNAIKYNRVNGRLGVKTVARDGFVEVAVSNDGEPIPAEELPLLFERFRRSKAARAGKTKGTGLGLSIAKRIVEAWGGRIWAESGARGATFRFTVPLRDRA